MRSSSRTVQKSDLGNILDIFGTDNTVLVPDPVYPVYVDTNVMAGRKIVFADANEANGFPAAAGRVRSSATSSISALRTTRPALLTTAQV